MLFLAVLANLKILVFAIMHIKARVCRNLGNFGMYAHLPPGQRLGRQVGNHSFVWMVSIMLRSWSLCCS